ncbi:MAG: carotenoid biosynthesis protein [Anaerolineae bacterium]|nr:carotenoid biosynthesis protein [Anaerolineae bacterium]
MNKRMQVNFYLNPAIPFKQLPVSRLFAAWILAMIALPIVNFFLGQAALPLVITLSTLLQVTLVLTFLVPTWGWRITLRSAITVMGLAWLIEFTGSTTGYPFGAYHYTNLMQPQIGGVPILIPLAWLMMLPPAWAVARRIAGSRSRLAFIAWSALAMTAWDLFLDPQMVAWGLWAWTQPGGYFGIPWINYLGWLLASALITAVVRPGPLPTRPLMLIYAITWLLESLGLFFFWGLPGPALVGFAGMGSLLWLAFMKRKIGD